MEFYRSIAPKIKTIPRFFSYAPLYEYVLTFPNVSNVLLAKGADIEVLRAQCKVHKNVVEGNLEDVVMECDFTHIYFEKGVVNKLTFEEFA